jgi:rhamnulokinase
MIQIIGGGANNHFLNQLTADATGLRVVAGPTEATAIGNIMIQAKAMGYVSSLNEIREVIANSFELSHFSPTGEYDWDAAYSKYLQIIS